MLNEKIIHDPTNFIFNNFINEVLSKKNTLCKNKKTTLDSINNSIVYCIGKNDEAIALSKKVNVSGIIDDFADENSTYNGIPVINSKSININSIIVNCSSSIAPVKVLKIFKQKGFNNIINYFEIQNYSTFLLPDPIFMTEMKGLFNTRKTDLEQLYSFLEDSQSRKTLLDLVLFKLTNNPHFMRNYEVNINNQYFEDFMNYNKEIFVDAGGYDADTSTEFLKRVPSTEKIFFIEPSSINMAKAKKNLHNDNRIIYIENALSEIAEKLIFDEKSGSSSKVDSFTGTKTVYAKPLDTLINEKVTLIKMDLEGWELKALNGAKNLIKRYNPKLAIAVYHKANDFLDIPKYILSINKNYKVYIRHYTQGWSETIMYFLPTN